MRGMIFIACLATLTPGISRADDFTPWNADVAAGDHAADHAHSHAATSRTRHDAVYNGAQAGAWLLIRFFQRVISPQDGPNCRFHPTCSRYGREAVERHGGLLGAIMAGDRLIRCNPYNPPGDDPVPPTLK